MNVNYVLKFISDTRYG